MVFDVERTASQKRVGSRSGTHPHVHLCTKSDEETAEFDGHLKTNHSPVFAENA